MKVCPLKFIRHVRILGCSHPSGGTLQFNPGIHVSGGWINRAEAARSWMGFQSKRSPFDPSRGVPCVRVQAVQNEDVSEDGWWERRFGSGRTRPTCCEEVKRLFQPQSEEPPQPVIHLLLITKEKGGCGPDGVLTLVHSCNLNSLYQREKFPTQTLTITTAQN